MQTKQIGIILLIGLLILGVIGAGIPYTTSQFIWQSTDLNYIKFYAGEYDGNGLIIDGNIFTIFDLNGSGGSGSFTDTNFETAGLTLTGSNTGDQDLSGYIQLAGGTMTGALKMGDNVTINQGGSDQYEQYFDGTNMNFDLTSGNFIFTGGDFDIEDTSPYFTLKDTSNSGTSSVSRIQFKGSDDVVNSWIGDTSSGDGDFEIRNILDADLEFWTNNLKRMIIDNGGRVGIGTPNPGEKLEVNGNIKQTADNDKIIQGAVDEYSQYFDGTNQNFETTSGDIILNPTGNVGIGTASPGEKLEVNGKILADDKIMFTQIDGNEFIDSLNGGYMDYGATTAHRFNADIQTTGSIKGVHKTADGTNAVADGTYNFYNDGATSGQVTSMTIKDGIVTSLGQVP